MLASSAAFAVMRYPPVRLTRSYIVKTNKDIFEIFFTDG